ncbi:MAG: YIP1 family protein [Thermoanaerobaculia bacterium]
MATFTERMIGAAKLDVETYEEVEADTTATGQAMLVVVLSSVAAGIGALGSMGIVGLLIGTIAALVGWFIWAGLIFIIGTKILPEPQTEADMGQLLRTIGFASSPGILRLLGFIPVLGTALSFAVAIWMLVATVVATRQALDYKSTGRAVAVCAIGFVVYLVVSVVIGSIVGLGAMAAAGVS